MNIKRAGVAGLIVLAVLGASPDQCPQQPDAVTLGNWGGLHMGMVVSDTGAAIEYDCAAGRITQPLRLDQSGTFSWNGLFFPGHGGPSRIGEQLDPHVAQYTGRVTGDHMTVTLHVADSLNITQEYTLTRGASPQVFKCL